MIDYSQNGEQKIILDYFKDSKRGTFLDIGANDGITLSNTYGLSLMNWMGVCVEPSPKAFDKLTSNHEENPIISLYNCAISTKTGKFNLLESDGHEEKKLGENVALLSTFKPTEVARWKGTQKFTPIEVDCYTWKDFLIKYDLHDIVFDMINIDAEGLDFEILQQINLQNTKLLIIEWNGNKNIAGKIVTYCNQFGLREIHRNGENIILVR